MEFIDGVLMVDYIKELLSDCVKVKWWDDENDVDCKEVGEKFYVFLL